MVTVIGKTQHFLVVCKEAGVSFHRSGKEEGFVEQVRKETGIDTLFPLHRLDTMTSGLLLFALSKTAAMELSALFQQGKIEKLYLAISDQPPKKKQGMIIGDIIKARRGMWKLTRSRTNPSVTQFISQFLVPGKRLYLLHPKTGKTHQIRVVMKSFGAPVLGDPLYAKKNRRESKPERGYLHAWSLRFIFEGKEYCYYCPPRQGSLFADKNFQDRIKIWVNPWDLPWGKGRN